MNKSTIVAFANAPHYSESIQWITQRYILHHDATNTPTCFFWLESRPLWNPLSHQKVFKTWDACITNEPMPMPIEIFSKKPVDHPEKNPTPSGDFFNFWLGLPGNKPMKASIRSRNRSPPTLASWAVTVATRRLSFFVGDPCVFKYICYLFQKVYQFSCCGVQNCLPAKHGGED